MDRQLTKSERKQPRILLAGAAIGLSAMIGLGFIASFDGSRKINTEYLSVGEVTEEAFQEYIPVTGTVEPKTTVYLDLAEGGIVETIHIQGGNPVHKGDLIVTFSNNSVQKENIDSETRLLENLNQLRNSKIALTEKQLVLKEQLLDLNYQLLDAEKNFNRLQALIKKNSQQVSRELYETSRDSFAYMKEKQTLLKERIFQESLLSQQQDTQIDDSIKRVNKSLEVLYQIAEGLELRAPIDGFLSSMDVEIGQSFHRGQRIGQIDKQNGFVVRAAVDQYYIAKVEVGQLGRFSLQGHKFSLEVKKVYPEVTNNQFTIDLTFVDGQAGDLKRGQSVNIDLNLSRSRSTLVADKGGFYRQTRGRWVYLIKADGTSAIRTPIVAGRQNPRKFEVVNGLNVGDRIITSSYEFYEDAETLTFSQPLKVN